MSLTSSVVTHTSHLLPHFVVAIAVTACGVRLYADKGNEHYYIEAPKGFTRSGMELTLITAARHGLDLIPEDECPADVFSDGTQRIYLHQTIAAFS